MHKVIGFTLIELMIVIAIIAIITTLALPSYNKQVADGRRADAQSLLIELSQKLERRYLKNGTYTGQQQTKVTRFYNLEVIDATHNGYVLLAEPRGPQQTNGIVLLWSTGAKGWDRDNSLNQILDRSSATLGLAADELSW